MRVNEGDLLVGDIILDDTTATPIAIVVNTTDFHFELQFYVDGSIKRYVILPRGSYRTDRLNAVLRDLSRIASC